MEFKIIPSRVFNKQLSKLGTQTRQQIYKKIELLKENPYRNKKITSKRFNKLFRIRINVDKKEMRLIYVVIEPKVILACFLERKKDYKDLDKYLKGLF